MLPSPFFLQPDFISLQLRIPFIIIHELSLRHSSLVSCHGSIKKTWKPLQNCKQKCSHTNVLLVFFSFSQTWDPQQHGDNQIILENFGTSKLLLFQHWHGSWALTSQIMFLANIQSWWSSLSAKQLKEQCTATAFFGGLLQRCWFKHL